jgi:uncharacterized protein (DUF2267 family)
LALWARWREKKQNQGAPVGYIASSPSSLEEILQSTVARSALRSTDLRPLLVARPMLIAFDSYAGEALMNEMQFVRQVADRTYGDERRAETLIFAVFQELRDRLTPSEAADVAAQLPSSLKMLWMSFDRPDRKVRRVHEGQFLNEIARMAGLEDAIEAEVAVTAVFAVLQEAFGSPTGTKGVAGHVLSQLPADLKQLWLSASF